MKTNVAETVRGGRVIIVMFRDGGTEEVLVRQLPVKLFAEYAQRIDDEELQVEMFCDKPAGWAATLTVESHEEVVAIGEEVNNAAFFRWCGRRTERRAGMVGAVRAPVAVMAPPISPNGSPKSPSSAA